MHLITREYIQEPKGEKGMERWEEGGRRGGSEKAHGEAENGGRRRGKDQGGSGGMKGGRVRDTGQ